MPVAILSMVLAARSPALGGGQPTSIPLEPFQGVVASRLAEYRRCHVGCRSEQDLVEWGSFTLPYVLAAAESTRDPAWRAKLQELARRILRSGHGQLDPSDPLSREMETLDVEYPPFDFPTLAPLGVQRLRAVDSATLRNWPESLLAARLRTSFLLHADEDGHEPAFEAVLAFARTHPGRIEEALDTARGYARYVDVDPLADLARKTAWEAPFERAATIELGIANLYVKGRRERLARVRSGYPGTSAALMAEESLIEASVPPTAELCRELVDFADRHRETRAAGQALGFVAFQLCTVNLCRELGVRERLRELARVAERVFDETAFDASSAHEFVKDFCRFYLPRDASEEDRSALLEVGRTFHASHFLPDALAFPAATTRESFEMHFRRIFHEASRPWEKLVELVDAEYARLEAACPDDASVKWSRAVFQAESGLIERSLGELQAVEDGWPGTLYARKSLATRAVILYAQGSFETAAELFARYVEQNPDSEYAWLAALRVGHAWLRSGNASNARAAYQKADARYGDHLLLRFLLPLAMGRADERLGHYVDAADQLRHTLAAWPKNSTTTPSTRPRDLRLRWSGPDPDGSTSREEVQRRLDLLTREGATTEELDRFLAADHRGQRGDPAGAAQDLATFLAGMPQSALAPDARERLSTLAITAALEVTELHDRDRLLGLAEEWGDPFGAFAVALYRSCLLLQEEDAERAPVALSTALEEWWRNHPSCEPRTSLEADVAAALLAACPPVSPTGGRYRLIDVRTPVVLADGTQTIVRTALASGEGRVLRFTTGQISEMTRIIDGVGGAERTCVGGSWMFPGPEGGLSKSRSSSTISSPWWRATGVDGIWRRCLVSSR